MRPSRFPASGGDPVYGVREYRRTPAAPRPTPLAHELTFDDFRSAAMYRSMLIAERSDHGDLFWDGSSPGSAMEIQLFRNEDTPLKVFRAR